MRYIDVETWDRAMHYKIFKDNVQPHYCITFNLDITNFLSKIKEKGFSFTFAFIYAVTTCANQIEQFRCRFLDEKPVIYDRIDTMFNYLNKETELFKAVNVPMQESMEKYVALAKETEANQKEYFVVGDRKNNIYQFSPIPWISFTNISHTESGEKSNATPVFNWGKYFEDDGKIMLPFSVKVHHSFVDGVHVGKLFGILQDYLNSFE